MSEKVSYSAGYLCTSNHFSIYNLPQNDVEIDFLMLIRYLQRGSLMPFPDRLLELTDTTLPEKTISKYIPLAPIANNQTTKPSASNLLEHLFLETHFPVYLPEFTFLKEAFWVAPKLKDILLSSEKPTELEEQTVNLYLPLSQTAILISDGIQAQRKNLENYLKEKGVYVIHFTVEELKNQTDLFDEKINWLKHQLEKPKFDTPFNQWRKASQYAPSTNTIQYYWWSAVFVRVQMLLLELLYRKVIHPDDETWQFLFLLREQSYIPESVIKAAFDEVEEMVHRFFPDLYEPDWMPILALNIFSAKDFDLDKEKLHSEEYNQSLKIDLSILSRNTPSTEWIAIRNNFQGEEKVAFKSINGKSGIKQTEFLPYEFVPSNFVKRDFSQIASVTNYYKHTSRNTIARVVAHKALNGQSLIVNFPLEYRDNQLLALLCSLQANPSILVIWNSDSALDKKEELAKAGLDKVLVWTSETSNLEVEYILAQLKRNSFFLLIISSEVFELESWKQYIKNSLINWAYFFVEEAEKLSEWYGGFDVSHLPVEQAYFTYFSDSRLILMSRLLSKNTLDDLQYRFAIPSSQLINTISFSTLQTRFDFINSQSPYTTLLQVLKNNLQENPQKTGLIFTSQANSSSEVELLSERLTFDLGRTVHFYANELPKDIYQNQERDATKRTFLRQALKEANALLVVSTPTLGESVSLDGIDFIVQYGLPFSLSQLLKKSIRNVGKPISVYTIFEEEKNEEILFDLFKPESKVSTIEHVGREISWLGGDLYQHLTKWSKSQIQIEKEIAFLKHLYDKYCQTEGKNYIDAAEIRVSYFPEQIDKNTFIKKSLNRLFQMGILSSWHSEQQSDSYPVFEIEVREHTQQSVEESLLAYFKVFEPDFDFDSFCKTIHLKTDYSILEKYAYIFLKWVQDNIAFQVKKEIKEAYDFAKSHSTTIEIQELEKVVISKEPFSITDKLIYFDSLPIKTKFSKPDIRCITEELNPELTNKNLDRLNILFPSSKILYFWQNVQYLLKEKDYNKEFENLLKNTKQVYHSSEEGKEFVKLYVECADFATKNQKNVIAQSILEIDYNYASYLYHHFEDDCSLNYLLKKEFSILKDISAQLL